MRPFSLPAGERTFGFLAGRIARLLRIGGWTLGGEDPSEIRARVEDIYAFAPARRTLGVLVRSLPSKMWPAMGRWHGDGAWGRYFDNAADADDLNFEDWQVIDMAGAASTRTCAKRRCSTFWNGCGWLWRTPTRRPG